MSQTSPDNQFSSQEPLKHIAIVGGGITGLAAAYTLRRDARFCVFPGGDAKSCVSTDRPIRYTLYESDSRLGGKILTAHEDGFTIEGGPDSFIRQKPWAARLAQEIGLGDRLVGTNPHPGKTYVLDRGRLIPLPDGVMLIVPTRFLPFVTSSLISWPGKIRMGIELFIPPRKIPRDAARPRPQDSDESLGGFIRRRLGQEALEKIAEPLLSGIHVSDPEVQSLLGTFPSFRDLELKYGGLIKGMVAQRRTPAPPKDPTLPASAFISLEGGMEQLVDGLCQTLDPASLRTNSRVTAINPDPSGGYRLTLADGSQVMAGAVILATPAHVSARLLEGVDPALARQLAGIRYISTATISLGYPISNVSRALDGFGYIVPRKSNHGIRACTWSSIKFPGRAPQDAVLLRCFAGGPGHEDALERSDADLNAMARRELEPLMGISGEPVLGRVFRWPQGNPQYDVGHLERVSAMQSAASAHPGLFLAGSAYEGVGVPDCIFQGQAAAGKAAQFLASGEHSPATTLPVPAYR